MLAARWLGRVPRQPASSTAALRSAAAHSRVDDAVPRRKFGSRRRPNPSPPPRDFAIERYNVDKPPSEQLDPTKPPLKEHDLARPHVYPGAHIRRWIRDYLDGKTGEQDFRNVTDLLHMMAIKKSHSELTSEEGSSNAVEALNFFKRRDEFIEAVNNNRSNVDKLASRFIHRATTFPPNQPDVGPQSLNRRVGPNMHLNVEDDKLTSASRAAVTMPPRNNVGVAMADADHLLMHDGTLYPVNKLPPEEQELIRRHPPKIVRWVR